MEKIQIKLKECCLDCENFSPDGVIGFGGLSDTNGKRFIGCGHMAVCWKYITADKRCQNCSKWDKTAHTCDEFTSERLEAGGRTTFITKADDFAVTGKGLVADVNLPRS